VAAILVALFIASLKASLVAAYFMHLISEKKLIYAALTLTAVLFLVLMVLPVSHFADRGL
jgi:caa(3)-type oxidase subunit IV